MIKPPNEEKMSAESEIRLFLRIFPLLVAHFELKDGVTPGHVFQSAAKLLSERYEEAADDEKQSDPGFVRSLPSIPRMPAIKKDILDD